MGFIKEKLLVLSALIPMCFLLSTNLVGASCPGPGSSQCSPPPFTGIDTGPPNILFVLDVSGSMDSCVYNTEYEDGTWHCCGYKENCHNNYSGDEEGYFDPEKIYVLTQDFGNLDKAAYCNAVPGCEWNGNECVSSGDTECENIEGKHECQATEGCRWDFGGRKCVSAYDNCNVFHRIWREAKCEDFGYSECNKIPGCSWNGGKCTGAGRLNMPDPNDCSNVPDRYKDDCERYWKNKVDYADDGDPSDYCPLIRAGIGKFKTRRDKNGERYSFKGSCLNFHFMRRIDILRWAITGGNLWGCELEGYEDEECDPDFSPFCDDETCILKPKIWYSQRGIEVPKDRLYGVAQKAETLDPKPRMGVIFFSKYVREPKIYLGDYPDGDTPADAQRPYTYLKRFVNAIPHYGGTGTVKAMWEAYDYFKQRDEHDYDDGFDLDEGTYKDPLYICDANGNDCVQMSYCAHNFVILISDGQWNQPGCRLDSDPVNPAYHLHTDALRNINGHEIHVDKVYTVGVLLHGTGEKALKNVAMYGSFDTSHGEWPGGTSGLPDEMCKLDDCCDDPNCGQGSGCEDVPNSNSNNCHRDWDKDCNGVPDTFYSSYNAQELKDSLFTILEEIVGSGSAGSVATITQQVLGEDIVLRGAFRQKLPDKIWQGHLEVYWPYEGCGEFTNENTCNNIAGCSWTNNQCKGTLYSFQLRENEGKFCSDSSFQGGHCWDAGKILKDKIINEQSSREIFTFLNGNKVGLDEVDSEFFALDENSDFNGDGSVNDTDVGKLKNWIKGTEDGDGTHMRSRGGWVLGDIVYSTPVVVGAPSLASVSKEVASESCNCACGSRSNECEKQCFYCYRYKNLHRDRVVYVGANDGMVHAFLVGEWDENQKRYIYEAGLDPDGDGHKVGDELWAYIPSNLLSELKCLAKPSYGTEGGCQHRSMVDLSPMAWDVYIDHDNDGTKEWRTVLIGGERGGGDVYFAIDVTNPNDPQILWEYSVIRNLIVYKDNEYPRYQTPFTYEEYLKIKNLPLSWTTPYVKSLQFPMVHNYVFYRKDPLDPSDLTPGYG